MGGVAVAYQHARGLVERGHEVTVVAPRRSSGLRGLLLHSAVRVRNRLHGIRDAPHYTEAGVRTVEVESWEGVTRMGHDAVIGIGHQTLPHILRILEKEGGLGVSFIQDGVRHGLPGGGCSWTAPLLRVAVSQWIAAAVEASGVPVAAVLPNAVDASVFSLTEPLVERGLRVVALYHRHPVKGPNTLVDTLRRIKNVEPRLEADVISARPPRHRLPSWVRVHLRPEAAALAELYNGAAVCLHTSRLEGWGLVPMEAAACGCAVVATESRGVNEFLVPGRSMRQVSVDDAEGLARETMALLSDQSFRIRVANAGIEDVARFSWSDSTSTLERTLLAHLPAS